jgi:uncharacterized repeat protein (TIGR03803 family)
MTKKMLSVFVFCIQSISLLLAQPILYGLTSGGGSYNTGTLFSFDVATGTMTKLHDFNCPIYHTPRAMLFQATDGKLYGGVHRSLFSFDPATGMVTTHYEFDESLTMFTDDLMQASNGKIYGVTSSYDTRNNLLFSLDPATNSISILHRFTGDEMGETPISRIVEGQDGKIYGIDGTGGDEPKSGMIFSFDPNTGVFTNHYNFNFQTGWTPNSNIIQAADGKFYGTTKYAPDRRGTIFSYEPGTDTYVKLFQFITGTEEEEYYSWGMGKAFTQARNGLLYGVGINIINMEDKGILYSFDPRNSNVQTLFNFNGLNGEGPADAPLQLSDGRLIGLTTYGGSANAGIIYACVLNENGGLSSFQKLYDFDGMMGAKPISRMTEYVSTWKGTASSQWSDPANWMPAVVPSNGASVIIPANTPHQPFIDIEVITGNIRWETGSRILIGGTYGLTVNGAITGQGSFKGGDNSKLTINGPLGELNFDQQDRSSRSLSTLTLNKPAQAILGEGLDIHKELTLNNASLNLNDKHLTLRSNADRTARIGDLTGSTLAKGTQVTVERYIPSTGRRWRLLTAPLNDITVNTAWQDGKTWNGQSPLAEESGTLITGQQQGNATNANARGFDFWKEIANSSASAMSYTQRSGQGLWSPLGSTRSQNAFNNHQSYLVFIRGPRHSTFTSTPPSGLSNSTVLRPKGIVKQGDQTAWIDGSKGFTLLGNPYPSQIDFDAVYHASGNGNIIKRQFWVWDAMYGSSGNFVAVVFSGGRYVEVPRRYHLDGQASPLTTIPSGQGFFVLPLTSASGMLKFTESGKTSTNPASPYILLQDEKPARIFLNLMRILPNDTSEIVDGVLATYGNGYRMEPDDQADMPKLDNFSENIAILQQESVLTADARPTDKQDRPITLKIWNMEKKNYRFVVQAENHGANGLQAFLKDDHLRKRTALDLTGGRTQVDFTVTSDASSSAQNRFSIVFESRPAAATQIIEESTSKIILYPNPLQGRRLSIRMHGMPKDRYTMQLFNTEGKLVISRQFNHSGTASEMTFDMKSLPAGSYQLSLLTGNKTMRSETLIVQ